MLNEEIKKSMDASVLCWLATVSESGQPNVSPKEIFIHLDDYILVANISSPNTVKNIQNNKQVAISFIDILVQKGYQVHGEASIVNEGDKEYKEYSAKLLPLLGERFKLLSIIKIVPTRVKRILAPSYQFYPETMEEDQVESAKRVYNM